MLKVLPGALFITTLFLFLGSANASPRIIGGSPEKQAGSTVALVEKNVNSYRGYFCAGTLLQPRWVLTARHCLEAYGLRNIDVITGRVDLRSSEGKRIAPVRAYYNKNENYEDIALLYLGNKSPSPTSPLASSIPVDGDDVEIKGWGAKKLHYPRVLQKSRVAIRENAVCQEAYAFSFSPEKMLCAGTKGRDACWGDSGGPLLWQGSVLGVASFGGLRCAQENYPTAYIRIPGWVKERLQNPPKKYANLRPGKDTKREPRPYVLFFHTIQGDGEVNEYALYISAYSNFSIKKARARIIGSKNLVFCQNEWCVEENEWFRVPVREGRRHADIIFTNGNEACPSIEMSVKTKHEKKRFVRKISSFC